jgi:hypothetical protein
LFVEIEFGSQELFATTPQPTSCENRAEILADKTQNSSSASSYCSPTPSPRRTKPHTPSSIVYPATVIQLPSSSIGHRIWPPIINHQSQFINPYRLRPLFRDRVPSRMLGRRRPQLLPQLSKTVSIQRQVSSTKHPASSILSGLRLPAPCSACAAAQNGPKLQPVLSCTIRKIRGKERSVPTAGRSKPRGFDALWTLSTSSINTPS